MVGRRLSDRNECQSRNCREVRYGRGRVTVTRVESAVVHIRIVWRRKRLDGEVRGSPCRERPRENVRNEGVGSKDNREVKGVLLEKEVPADDFGRLGVADEHKIPMNGVHDEVGALEEVVQFGNDDTLLEKVVDSSLQKLLERRRETTRRTVTEVRSRSRKLDVEERNVSRRGMKRSAKHRVVEVCDEGGDGFAEGTVRVDAGRVSTRSSVDPI